MFKNSVKIQRRDRLKNLTDISFKEKANIESKIDEVAILAKDPYAASLPLISSAAIGDEKRYATLLAKMLNMLDELEKTPESYSQWMRNNSFKAWMWGRILLAADSADDADTIIKAQKSLQGFLEKDATDNDNFSFFTWAWGYRAALDQKEYVISKKRMLDDATRLTSKFKETRNHEVLSDALWAWVMNLQAAAYAGDQAQYNWIKEQIKAISAETSVTQALEKGLLRTAQSNDYPAWAMAKTRYAAIVIEDKPLYQEIEKSLMSSIDAAEKANAKAEYVLSILDNQLAILTMQHLQEEKSALVIPAKAQ